MRGLTILAFILVGIGPARSDDWPQWLGTKRDGVWRETGIIESFPKEGPPVLWRQPLAGGYAGPAVAGNRVFVMDYKADSGVKPANNPFDTKAAPGTEGIRCLDARTGQPLWKHEYPVSYTISYASGPRCTPTVADGRVHCLGAMGDYHCLDATTGAVLWKYSFRNDFNASLPIWGFAAHPLIVHDQVICLVGGRPQMLVVAFNVKTGQKFWSSGTGDDDFGYCPPTLFDFHGERHLIIWHSKAVLGLDPATGKERWRFAFDVRSSLTAPTPRRVGEDQLLLVSFYNGSKLLKIPKQTGKAKATANGPTRPTACMASCRRRSSSRTRFMASVPMASCAP
jgi:outer membrane protein assembly factor BamB